MTKHPKIGKTVYHNDMPCGFMGKVDREGRGNYFFVTGMRWLYPSEVYRYRKTRGKCGKTE